MPRGTQLDFEPTGRGHVTLRDPLKKLRFSCNHYCTSTCVVYRSLDTWNELMRICSIPRDLTKISGKLGATSARKQISRQPLSQLRHSSTLPSMSIPYTVPLSGGIPDKHKPHTESKTTILLPSAGAFLNPPQQFNRDLSVAVIRAWNERRKEILERRFKARLEKGKGKKKVKGKGKLEEKAEVAVNPEGALGLTVDSARVLLMLGRVDGEWCYGPRRALSWSLDGGSASLLIVMLADSHPRNHSERQRSPSSRLCLRPVCGLYGMQRRYLMSSEATATSFCL